MVRRRSRPCISAALGSEARVAPFGGDVWVWRVDLDQPEEIVESALELLPPAELRRADHGTQSVRRRRILSRAALRSVLAPFRDCRPQDLQLTLGRFGKPALRDGAHTPLHFNASKSGDLCLIAVTRLGPVGVDIEHLAAIRDIERIAQRFLAPIEADLIRALPDGVRANALLMHWTCKEAYVKATGVGLSQPLDRVIVLAHPTQPRIIALDDEDPATCTVLSLEPGPDTLAAVAVRCRDRRRPVIARLATFDWPFEPTSMAADWVVEDG